MPYILEINHPYHTEKVGFIKSITAENILNCVNDYFDLDLQQDSIQEISNNKVTIDTFEEFQTEYGTDCPITHEIKISHLRRGKTQ